MYAAIEEGVKAGDINKIRTALGNICYTSRNFSNGEFDTNLEYVLQQGIEIFEQYDGKKLLSDENKNLSDEDFSDAVFQLQENFCRQRIDDVKNIGMRLYQTDSAGINENEQNTDINNDHNEIKNRNLYIAIGIILVIIIICGIIILKK